MIRKPKREDEATMITLYKFERGKTPPAGFSSRRRTTTDGLDAAIEAAGSAGASMPFKHSEDPDPAGTWTLVQIDFADDEQRFRFEDALPVFAEKNGVAWQRYRD